MTVAAVRPDSWNLPLFLHVLGAMVLVGSLIVVAWTLAKAWRGDSHGFTFLAARVLMLGAIPAFIVMRGSAQWIADKEGLADKDPTWIGIGSASKSSRIRRSRPAWTWAATMYESARVMPAPATAASMPTSELLTSSVARGRNATG